MSYIVHDCDPTIFYYIRDVDDSLALGYELRKYEDPQLIGITTVFGNNSVDKTYRDAIRVVRKSGKEIPVYKGASSSKELGMSNDAVSFIIEASKKYGEIQILATGPLTNVASAFLIDNELVDHVSRIVIMGGAVFVKGNVPFVNAEFNFWRDYKAAQIIINKAKNVVLTPLDVTTTVKWGKDVIRALENKKDPLAKFLGRGAKKWATFMSVFGGFHPHDILSAVYITRPDLFETVNITLVVEKKGRVKAVKEGVKTTVIMNVKKDEFKEEFLSAFY